jgi:hypothetical protein
VPRRQRAIGFGRRDRGRLTAPSFRGGIHPNLQGRRTIFESNKDILRAGYEAFGRQDIPTVMGLFDENIEWTEPETLDGIRVGQLCEDEVPTAGRCR